MEPNNNLWPITHVELNLLVTGLSLTLGAFLKPHNLEADFFFFFQILGGIICGSPWLKLLT